MDAKLRNHQIKKKQAIRQRLDHSEFSEHVQRRVREPDPVIGWEGGPWWTVARHNITDQIEIWWDKPGEEQRVCFAPLDPPPSIPKLLVGLMEWGDNHRLSPKQKLDKIDKHNDAIMVAKDKKIEDELDEARDRLELAVVKDIQGFRGRLY